ncbi:MAG: hypothetical protein AAF657_11175 [Acidobacteriota bacterium]
MRQSSATRWLGHATPQHAFRSALLLTSFCLVTGGVQAGDVTPNGTQPGLTHPIIQPFNCEFCHGNFDDDNNIEPWPTWAGSMMANSARDPLFWAALDVANNDVPGIGDFCLRCHTPDAWLAGRSEPPGGSVDGCGLLGNLDEPDNDFDGVSCHMCHRMMVNENPPPGEQEVYFENAEFWIDDEDCTTPGSGPCRRGPYDYDAGGGAPPPHQWAFSEYHKSSDICGNCHNITSPIHTLIDENGDDTGLPYPIERTFKEWQQSDYADGGASAQSCQDCHMPQAIEEDVFACAFLENDRTGDLGVHQFAGGNTWIPAVLRDEYPALDRAEEFDATIAWANEMLQNRSATLEVTSPDALAPGQDLGVSVKVTNLSGHKLPTGYTEGRRMWIHVVARDGQGDVIWESGAYDDATGDLTKDEQAKVYEVKPGIWNELGTGECDTTDAMGRPEFHFVLNNCYASDNRIPPLGFTGGGDIETMPVAYTYPETSPGSGVLVNFDVTDYLIPIPAQTAFPIAVEATLRYQTASKDYIEFLRNEAVANGFPDDCLPRTTGVPTASRGEIMYDLWETYGRSPPVDMASDGAQVTAAILEIPSLSLPGLALLAGLLAVAGLRRLR